MSPDSKDKTLTLTNRGCFSRIRPSQPIVRGERKTGRNEICPKCKSGKKFKNCHGR
ncbi:MAG: SEC-C metal-binding domain-containing protein [Bacteroidales bacterium]